MEFPDIYNPTLIFEQRGPFLLEDLGSENRELLIDDIKKYPKLSTRTYTIKENGFITVSFKMPDNIRWNSLQGWIYSGNHMETNTNSLMVNNTPMNELFSFSVSYQSLYPVFKGDIITDYGVITYFMKRMNTDEQNHIDEYTLGQFSPEVNFIPYLKKNK